MALIWSVFTVIADCILCFWEGQSFQPHRQQPPEMRALSPRGTADGEVYANYEIDLEDIHVHEEE